MPENPEYLSVAEAAKRLNVSQSFLNKRRVYGGGPPYLKFQSTIRYEASSLVKWAESCSRNSTSEDVDRGGRPRGRPRKDAGAAAEVRSGGPRPPAPPRPPLDAA